MSEKLTIFISYRRGDEQDFVERIRDWFVQRYGADNVFMDFAHIPPYVKFKDFIRQRLQQSDVFIPIIGPKWLESLKAKAADEEEDFVLFEIETALKQGIMIAPIRIKGGVMPKKRELPESIRELVDYNAPELVGGAAFLKDIQGLVEAVEIGWKQMKGGAPPPVPPKPNRDSSQDGSWTPPKLSANHNLFDDSAAEKLIHDLAERGLLPSMTKEEYVSRGIEKHKVGDYDGAIADYRQAMSLEPSYARAYYHCGIAREAKGDLDGALNDYNKAIHLGLGDADYYYHRAILYDDKLKNYPAALKDYEKYLGMGGRRRTEVQGLIREVKKKMK